MQSNFIDDRGMWWDAGSWLLRQDLHLTDVAGDIGLLIVNKLGFIRVSSRQRRTIITFRPKTVSRAALGALLYWLARQESSGICLTVAGESEPQRHEIVPSPRAAILRMEALVELEECSGKPRFSAHSAVLAEVERASGLSALFDFWKAGSGAFAEQDYAPILKRFAQDRYILFEPSAQRCDFRIVRAGMGLHIPDKQSHAALGGSRLDHVADVAYGRWTAKFYHAALNSGQPRYDHIKASITWPRAGTVQRVYSRLILPCRSKDGRPLMLGVSHTPPQSGVHRKAA
jgi:hypothetical protein